MRVGLLYALGPTDSYEEALRQIEAADRVGLDLVLFEEHHGSAGCPAVGSLAAAAASRTSGIRVGSSNRQVCLEYPVNVAEDWAVVDVISRGRAILGVTPGERPSDFRAAGVDWDDRDARFRESVDLVRTAWTQDSFQIVGEHVRFPLSADGEPGWRRQPYARPYVDPWRRGQYAAQYLPVLPKPVQLPHPPVWVTGHRQSTIEFAARRGLTFLCSSLETSDEVRTRAGWYAEAAHGAGRDLAEAGLAVAREVFVAEPGERAREIAQPSLRRLVEQLQSEDAPDRADLALVRGLDETKLLETCFVVGSPAEVVERVQELQSDTGMTHLVCRVWMPGRRCEDVLEAIRLLASEVQTRLSG